MTKESNIKLRCVTFAKKPVLSIAKQKGDKRFWQLFTKKLKTGCQVFTDCYYRI